MPERTALVVDDDLSIVRFIKDVLVEEGFAVCGAPDGLVASEYLAEHPDVTLLVTDVLMPDRDGNELILETLKAAKQRGQRPRIIAISGGGTFAGSDLYLDSADVLGADMTLAKPFTDTQLRRAVAEIGLGAQAAP